VNKHPLPGNGQATLSVQNWIITADGAMAEVDPIQDVPLLVCERQLLPEAAVRPWLRGPAPSRPIVVSVRLKTLPGSRRCLSNTN
jgi:hypothetical protein